MLADLLVPDIKCTETAGNYGRFVVEPLEKGVGVTLGNALRRVLLSSLPGAAVTWILIDGIQHEFCCIPNLKEDVIEFILNVKELRLKPLSNEPGKQLVLDVAGEGEICAADIKPSIDFEIANPELHLASLDSADAKFYVVFNVELGRGYIPGKSSEGLPVGALPVDAIFTPIHKVNFSVVPISPGEERSSERLILEVWTDNTISPGEAIRQSANVLINQFKPFMELEMAATEGVGSLGRASLIPAEKYSKPIEELGLSVRAFNSLRRGGVTNIGQLIEIAKDGLPPLPGLGAKSRGEVEDILLEMGCAVPGNTKKKEKE